MKYQIVLVLLLQITIIWTAPLKIIQAQPQVMMHTLQQPPPIETLQALKAQKLRQDLQASTKLQQMMMMNLQQQMATNTLQELAKIQSMQYAPDQIEMHPPDLMQAWLPQMPVPDMQPPITMPWQHQSEQQNMPWHQQRPEDQQQPVMQMIQQMSEDAMQEIALQQQMLALQQMQAFDQLDTDHHAHSSYTFPQPEPILILLPDDKAENTDHRIYKNTNEYETKGDEHTDQEGHEDEELDSVVVDSKNETGAKLPKGTRKAILLIPNARISIGGIISQIPWLPIEVNVPDTAIWAWNGIYNGISSIISIIGSRLPWRPRPQESAAITATEPSVKAFLKQLQQNEYGQTVPVYQVPLDAVIPVHFN